MFDKDQNIAILEALNIVSLLFRIKRSQPKSFGHVNKMSQERFPKQTLYAKINRKKPV